MVPPELITSSLISALPQISKRGSLGQCLCLFKSSSSLIGAITNSHRGEKVDVCPNSRIVVARLL
jgi:hypothetical protein